ncbi:norrin [Lates japonicus]|uniref:Norrin n=1 Tax=Lates japonicus TaxID=270547 RepID=A0AAD3MN83_LATJO|nr:norrin [Lates japonicus]
MVLLSAGHEGHCSHTTRLRPSSPSSSVLTALQEHSVFKAGRTPPSWRVRLSSQGTQTTATYRYILACNCEECS